MNFLESLDIKVSLSANKNYIHILGIVVFSSSYLVFCLMCRAGTYIGGEDNVQCELVSPIEKIINVDQITRIQKVINVK